jgi:hypothetical protein
VLKRGRYEQYPQPSQAQFGLLRGEEQPKIPFQHVPEDSAVSRGQGIVVVEPVAQRLAVFMAQVHLFWALHRHPYPLQLAKHKIVSGSVGWGGVTNFGGNVKLINRKHTQIERVADCVYPVFEQLKYLKKRAACGCSFSSIDL